MSLVILYFFISLSLLAKFNFSQTNWQAWRKARHKGLKSQMFTLKVQILNKQNKIRQCHKKSILGSI